MKTKFCMLLGALMLMCSLASCSNNNDADTITKQAINQCITLYKDAATGATQSGASTGYTILINYTKQTCEISITGLALPNGKSYPAVVLSDLHFQVSNEDIYTVNAASVQSSINGFNSAPVFTNVQFRLAHRNINDSYIPAFVLSFTVDGYDVTSSMQDIYLFGSTESTGPDGTPFTTDATEYQISLAQSGDKATIILGGAHFIQQMPALDIEFPDVPAVFDGVNLILKAESITPTIKGVPNPGFPITNLNAAIDVTGTSKISFSCTPKTMDGEFKVVATLNPFGATK